MTRKGPKTNLAASIRARLSQLARDRHEDFQFVLTRYAIERLLYRLSKSRHEPSFVLKGLGPLASRPVAAQACA